jgi:hypothetical protein
MLTIYVLASKTKDSLCMYTTYSGKIHAYTKRKLALDALSESTIYDTILTLRVSTKDTIDTYQIIA